MKGAKTMTDTFTFGDILLAVHQTMTMDLGNGRINTQRGKWSLSGIVQLSDRSAGEAVKAHSFRVGRAYRSELAAREAAAKRFSVIEWAAATDHGVLHGRVWAHANPEAVAYARAVLADREAKRAAFAARMEKVRAGA